MESGDSWVGRAVGRNPRLRTPPGVEGTGLWRQRWAMEGDGAPALLGPPHFATLGNSKPSEVGLECKRKSKLRN